MPDDLNRKCLDRDGGVLLSSVLTPREIDALAAQLSSASSPGPGDRIFSPPSALRHLLGKGPIGRMADAFLDKPAKPVRILVFDKNAESNWSVGWHQDRTIAVKRRVTGPGFETWTTKGGIPHVEPPYDYIEAMLSLRIHLDDCDSDNGPLKIIPGSHRLGQLSDKQVAELAAKSRARTIPAKSGDVLVLKTSIVHASERATNPTRRRVLHVDYSDRVLPGDLGWALD